MHTIFKDLTWEVEEIRNDEELEERLGGCTFLKAVRKNDRFSAQIRIEERKRQELIYTSVLVIAKRGRHGHDYDLNDLVYYRTKEFDFLQPEHPTEATEHPEHLAQVYAFISELKTKIDEKYFANE